MAGYYGLDPVLMGVKVSGSTTTLGVNDPELGSRISYKGEDYVFVYNDGGENIGSGYFCVVSARTGYSVTVSSVVQATPAFGVRKHSTLSTGAYGWVMTRGFCDVKNGMASTAIAAGDILRLGTDGKVDVPATMADEFTPACAHAVQATGSAGTAYAYVKTWG